jgi:hypothetical protein
VVLSITIEFSNVIEIVATLNMYKNAFLDFVNFQQNSFVRNKLTKLHPCGWKIFHASNPMYIKFVASQMCKRKKVPFTKYIAIPKQV